MGNAEAQATMNWEQRLREMVLAGGPLAVACGGGILATGDDASSDGGTTVSSVSSSSSGGATGTGSSGGASSSGLSLGGDASGGMRPSGSSSSSSSSGGAAPCTTCTTDSECTNTCGAPPQQGYNWCCMNGRCSPLSAACGSSFIGCCNANPDPCCSCAGIDPACKAQRACQADGGTWEPTDVDGNAISGQCTYPADAAPPGAE
jgi:hypothetical protein